MSTPNEGVVITVRGSFTSHHPPERATVRLAVGVQGPDKVQVHARTTEVANAVVAVVRTLHDPDRGPVTWWSSERLRTWSQKPWNQDGKQLPLVFHAQVPMQVKFRDVEVLARFLDDVGSRPGVAVEATTWALTEARRTELARDARRRAVADAVDRARDYAEAAGLRTVTPLAIADVGMLGDRTHGGAADGVAFARAAGGAPGGPGGAPLVLAPEDIDVDASVDARFLAT